MFNHKSKIINHKFSKGYSNAEVSIAVVLVVIMIFLFIYLIRLSDQMTNVRNDQRWQNLDAIAKAVDINAIENNGQLNSIITEKYQEICKANSDCGGVKLDYLVNEYIAQIPIDPKCNTYNTCYYIKKGAANRIYLMAPLAEKNRKIELSY